jgi:hypothetical protein
MINHWVSVGNDFSLPPANSPWNPLPLKGQFYVPSTGCGSLV